MNKPKLLPWPLHWLISVAVTFSFCLLLRVAVHQQPWTDWAFVIGWTLMFPTFMLPVIRYLISKPQPK